MRGAEMDSRVWFHIVWGFAPASESDSSLSTREIAEFGEGMIKDLWSEDSLLRGTI